MYRLRSRVEHRDPRPAQHLRPARARASDPVDAALLAGRRICVAQRKSNVAADGWYLQANYSAERHRVEALFVALRYASLSGDKSGQRDAGRASIRSISPAAIPTGTRARSARRSSTIPTSMRPASTLTLTPDDNEHHRVSLPLFRGGPDEFAARDSGGRRGAHERWRRAQQGARRANSTSAYTYIDQQEREHQRVRRLRGARGRGYKQSYSASGGDASGWWFLRSAVQFQLLMRCVRVCMQQWPSGRGPSPSTSMGASRNPFCLVDSQWICATAKY